MFLFQPSARGFSPCASQISSGSLWCANGVRPFPRTCSHSEDETFVRTFPACAAARPLPRLLLVRPPRHGAGAPAQGKLPAWAASRACTAEGAQGRAGAARGDLAALRSGSARTRRWCQARPRQGHCLRSRQTHTGASSRAGTALSSFDCLVNKQSDLFFGPRFPALAVPGAELRVRGLRAARRPRGPRLGNARHPPCVLRICVESADQVSGRWLPTRSLGSDCFFGMGLFLFLFCPAI